MGGPIFCRIFFPLFPGGFGKEKPGGPGALGKTLGPEEKPEINFAQHLVKKLSNNQISQTFSGIFKIFFSKKTLVKKKGQISFLLARSKKAGFLFFQRIFSVIQGIQFGFLTRKKHAVTF